MASMMVLEGGNVGSHLRAQFNIRGPFLPIQQLCRYSRPERLDHGIVITVASSFEAEPESEFVVLATKRPLRELRASTA